MKGAPAITRRPVIAIVTDESEAIIVARYAVWAASEQKRPFSFRYRCRTRRSPPTRRSRLGCIDEVCMKRRS